LNEKKVNFTAFTQNYVYKTESTMRTIEFDPLEFGATATSNE